MGNTTTNEEEPEERFRLQVDDRGRITVPKELRDRLGIEPDTDVVAYRSGSVLTVDPAPSKRLETATAGRDDWTDSTPTDAGTSLFGPMETVPTTSATDERDSYRSGSSADRGDDGGDSSGDGGDSDA